MKKSVFAFFRKSWKKAAGFFKPMKGRKPLVQWFSRNKQLILSSAATGLVGATVSSLITSALAETEEIIVKESGASSDSPEVAIRNYDNLRMRAASNIRVALNYVLNNDTDPASNTELQVNYIKLLIAVGQLISTCEDEETYAVATGILRDTPAFVSFGVFPTFSDDPILLLPNYIGDSEIDPFTLETDLISIVNVTARGVEMAGT